MKLIQLIVDLVAFIQWKWISHFRTDRKTLALNNPDQDELSLIDTDQDEEEANVYPMW